MKMKMRMRMRMKIYDGVRESLIIDGREQEALLESDYCNGDNLVVKTFFFIIMLNFLKILVAMHFADVVINVHVKIVGLVETLNCQNALFVEFGFS